jgi:cyclopropane-fatty-acyl-phospholipid synthase
MGLGEGFQAGDWETDDLTAVLKFFLENVDQNSERKLNVLWPMRLLHKFRHRRRHNSIVNSKTNIQEHYDIGNEFFSLFLDPSMTYSSGIFRTPQDSLETAQRNKLQAIIDKAMIGPNDHVLEIGSGWGSFAVMAAKQRGCKVTTVTISEEQHRAVKEKIRAENLEGRVEVLLTDYRTLTGSYDRIVSIEMMEALGHEYLPVFFKKCESLLRPNGIMVVQVITMLDQWYGEYRKRADWIQKYIFPGSHLPSLGALNESITESSQFIVENLENIAPHYARTLAEWRHRFRSVRGKLERMGYDQYFQRTFDFYFASCEAEFGTRVLNLLQLVLTRPNNQTLIQSDSGVTNPASGAPFRLVAS